MRLQLFGITRRPCHLPRPGPSHLPRQLTQDVPRQRHPRASHPALADPGGRQSGPLRRCLWLGPLALLGLLSLPVQAQAPSVKEAQPSAPSTAQAPATAAEAAPAAASAAGLAALRFDPPKLTFPSQRVGTTSTVQTLVVQAAADGTAATVYEAHTTGEFSIAPDKCVLAAQGSCAFSITYAPQKAGSSTGAVVLAQGKGGASRVAATLVATATAANSSGGLNWQWGAGSMWPVLALVAVYAVAVAAARWNLVARPAAELLQAEIDAVASRAEALKDSPHAPPQRLAQVQAKLDQARKRLRHGNTWQHFLNVLLWSRGQEHAGWTLLHEAKEHLALATPPDELQVALEDAEVQLRATDTVSGIALADRINQELARNKLDPHDLGTAVLQEAQAYLSRAAADLVREAAAHGNAKTALKTTELQAIQQRLVQALTPHPSLCAQAAGALAEVGVGTGPAASKSPALTAQQRLLLEHFLSVVVEQAKKLRTDLAAPLLAAAAGAAAGGATDDAASDANKAGAKDAAGKTAADTKTSPPAPEQAQLQAHLLAQLQACQQSFVPQAEALRKRIEGVLASAPPPVNARRNALLSEARNNLYDREDGEFSAVTSWHKKTWWLVGVALLLITALSAAVGNAVFFLMGATGGFISRLMRVLGRQQLPTDHAGAWTTLFLSPVAGALGGWTGVLLVAVAVKFELLGKLFASVTWTDPYAEVALALALVFGISERALVKVIEGLEGKLGVNTGASTGATTGANTASADAAAASKPKAPAPLQALAITTPDKHSVKEGAKLKWALSASGGMTPYTWEVKNSPDLGPEIELKGDSLQGQPKTVGSRSITLVVKDSAGKVCEKTVTLDVQPA